MQENKSISCFSLPQRTMFWQDERFSDKGQFCAAAGDASKTKALIVEYFDSITRPALHVIADFSIHSAAVKGKIQCELDGFRDAQVKSLEEKLSENCEVLYSAVQEAEKQLKSEILAAHLYAPLVPDDSVFRGDSVLQIVGEFDKAADQIIGAVPTHVPVNISKCDAKCLNEAMNSVKARVHSRREERIITGQFINDAVKQLIGMLRVIVSISFDFNSQLSFFILKIFPRSKRYIRPSLQSHRNPYLKT